MYSSGDKWAYKYLSLIPFTNNYTVELKQSQYVILMNQLKHILSFTLVILCVGCNPSIDETPVHLVDELVAGFSDVELPSPIEVRSVIGHAVDCSRSVSFVDMKWSLNSVFHRRTFAQFVVDYHRETRSDVALMHFIDCTSITHDYSPLYDLSGWDKQRHRIAGMGELIWMQNGRVLHVEPIGNFRSTDELVAKTSALFDDGG